MYRYTYVCIYIWIHMGYILIHMGQVYICIYIHMCTFRTQTSRYAGVVADACMYMYINICIYICTYVYICMYINMYTYVHIYEK